MNENRRQKRVASLLKNALSQSINDIIQTEYSCLTTITRIEMAKDLKSAYIHLSIYGTCGQEAILEFLQERSGYFRKSIASKTNLKYNPKLIFSLDKNIRQEEKIANILAALDKHD